MTGQKGSEKQTTAGMQKVERRGYQSRVYVIVRERFEIIFYDVFPKHSHFE